MYPIINDVFKYEKLQPLYSEFIAEINGLKYPVKVNKTASEIFNLCNGINSVENIIQILSKKYEEPYDVVKGMVEEFIDNANAMQHILMQEKKKEEVNNRIIKVGGRDYWTPEMVAIELTHKCPLKCKHCYIDAGNGESIETEKIMNIIGQCKAMGIDNIQLTGGEPLVHPDFFDILDVGLDNGITMHISTSGYIINEHIKEKFRKYKNNSKIVIQISIDGKRETHEKFRGVEGCYDRTMEFIHMVLELGIKLAVGTCISDQPYEELKQLSIMLRDMGISMHRYSPISNRGRAEDNLQCNTAADIKQIKGYIKMLDKELSNDKFRVFYFEEGETGMDLRYKHNCGLGQTIVKIDPYGIMYPCLMSDMKYADLNEVTLLQAQKNYSRIWENLYSPSQNLCGNCVDSELCNHCVIEAMKFCKIGKGKFAELHESLCKELGKEEIC